MKAKLIYLEIIVISLVVLLSLFLIGLNIFSRKYEAKNEISSTANYMEKEEIIEYCKQFDRQKFEV